jgi:hypothetical protein
MQGSPHRGRGVRGHRPKEFEDIDRRLTAIEARLAAPRRGQRLFFVKPDVEKKTLRVTRKLTNNNKKKAQTAKAFPQA